MTDSRHPKEKRVLEKMRSEGLPRHAADTFLLHFRRLLAGEQGFLGREDIAPVEELPTLSKLTRYAPAGERLLGAVAVVKLNGGLGTSMGLPHAKSLLTVRGGLTFLDLIARQVLFLRRRYGVAVPLLFMNSFRTHEETLHRLTAYPELALPGLPLGFVQNRVPKILEDGLHPAEHPADPGLAWCPPGHGDLYTCLAATGLLDELVERGIRWIFVSNADNLGAAVDPALLGYVAEEGFGFLMEAAERTPADRKGGHLCRLADGRLALREAAQVPPGEEDDFQDIARYRYFNTNNVWISLPALADVLRRHGEVLPLATIVNRKTLDPRDPSSPRVIQLETAVGAAISLFPKSAAVGVPRSRFSPVKTTADLLAVRSDAYELTPDARVVLAPARTAPPAVGLDERFYRRIDDFEARFPAGPPSLVACDSLAVRGDVTFSPAVVVRGEVRVTARSGPVTIPPGTVLTGTVEL